MHIRLGNEDPVLRRDPALDRLQELMANTLGFGVGFCEVWTRRESIYVETDVHMLAADGELCTIPCFIIARTTHRLLQDLRLYFDPAPIPGWVSRVR